MEHKTTTTSKKLRSQKRVTFDTRPHKVNIAKKSTFSRKDFKFYRHKGLQKRMLLQLSKIDITGYNLPRRNSEANHSDLFTCARLLPVGEILPGRDVQDPIKCADSSHPSSSIGEGSGHYPAVVSPSVALPKRPKKKKKHHRSNRETRLQNGIKKCGKSQDNKNNMSYDLILNHGEGSTESMQHSTMNLMEVEYESKLQETIDKITAVSPTTTEKRKCSGQVVKLPLANVGQSVQSSCGLEVKTLGLAVSTGVQAERGFVVDKEVIDSYIAVKVNEAFYEMKERLQCVEEKFSKVAEEKEKMEKILKEKVEMIRELSMPDFKPHCEDKAIATDPVELSPSSSDSQVVKLPKKSRTKKAKRHVATQTESDQHICFQSMTEGPLAPYLRLRSSSPISPDSESGEESDKSEKLEWMFQKSNTSARCHAMRPQVRLLRALKKNLANLRPSGSKVSKQTKGDLSDTVGWDALGPELQSPLIKLFKLTEFLQVLPLEPILTKHLQVVTQCLNHLLSHLPFPTNVCETLSIKEINKPRTKAMAAYVLGWRLREVITLVRTVYWNSSSDILPRYFKAELVQADRIAFKSLTFAVQGIRNTSISHIFLSNDKEFLESNSTTGPSTPPSASTTDLYGIGDTESLASCSSDSDCDEMPPPKRAKLVQNKPKKALQSTLGGASCKSMVDNKSVGKVFQGMNMSQLIAMSKIVQSQITEISGAVSSLRNIPRVGLSVTSVPSSSMQALPTNSSAPLTVQVISSTSGNVHSRVLCSPISAPAGQFTDLMKAAAASKMPVSDKSPAVSQSGSTDAQKVINTIYGSHHITSNSSKNYQSAAAAKMVSCSPVGGITRLCSKSVPINQNASSQFTSCVSTAPIVRPSIASTPPFCMLPITASAPPYCILPMRTKHSGGSCNVSNIAHDTNERPTQSSQLQNEAAVNEATPVSTCSPGDKPQDVDRDKVIPQSNSQPPVHTASAANSNMAVVTNSIVRNSNLAVTTDGNMAVVSNSNVNNSNVTVTTNSVAIARDSNLVMDLTNAVTTHKILTVTSGAQSCYSDLPSQTLQLHNPSSIQSHASNGFQSVSTDSSTYGKDMVNKLVLSRPVILKAIRTQTTVLIKWTFPQNVHSFVSKYSLFYESNITSHSQKWIHIGSVKSLTLPMAVTLSNISDRKPCLFTVMATFYNGFSSMLSEPVTI